VQAAAGAALGGDLNGAIHQLQAGFGGADQPGSDTAHTTTVASTVTAGSTDHVPDPVVPAAGAGAIGGLADVLGHALGGTSGGVIGALGQLAGSTLENLPAGAVSAAATGFESAGGAAAVQAAANAVLGGDLNGAIHQLQAGFGGADQPGSDTAHTTTGSATADVTAGVASTVTAGSTDHVPDPVVPAAGAGAIGGLADALGHALGGTSGGVIGALGQLAGSTLENLPAGAVSAATTGLESAGGAAAVQAAANAVLGGDLNGAIHQLQAGFGGADQPGSDTAHTTVASTVTAGSTDHVPDPVVPAAGAG